LDEEGDPVRQAQIFLFRKSVIAGRSRIAIQSNATTDSAGEFHASRLAPGTYFVGVQARPWYAQNAKWLQTNGEGEQATPGANLDVTYPMTYYADARDPASASPIAVAEGSSVRIQMTLQAVPAVRVEVSGLDPKPNRGRAVLAFQSGPGGFPIMSPVQNLSSNGREYLAGLAPGHYTFTFQEFHEGGIEFSGMKSVDVGANSTIDMASRAEPAITGRVVLEGDQPITGPLSVVLVSTLPGQNATAQVNVDGTFVVRNHQPLLTGRYELRLQGPQGLYLKSISAKGAKFVEGELEIAEGASVQLSLIAAKGVTHLDGIALKDEKPFAGAMVLLIPKDQNRSDFIRRDQSDSDGTFTLPDVPPGLYTLLAIDNGHDLAYGEPAVIGPYLAEGQVISMPDQSASPVTVRVLPRH
jgi:hypothetical protein